MISLNSSSFAFAPRLAMSWTTSAQPWASVRWVAMISGEWQAEQLPATPRPGRGRARRAPAPADAARDRRLGCGRLGCGGGVGEKADARQAETGQDEGTRQGNRPVAAAPRLAEATHLAHGAAHGRA